MNTITTGGRIAQLDGLRGMAILMVVSFHYINNQLLYSTGKVGRMLAAVTSVGWVGVDLFFVLSGFLITSVLLKNTASKNYFSSFYVRRVVRIIPNYYLLLIIFLLILYTPYFQDNYFLTGNNVIPLWSYFTMLHNFFMARMVNMGNTALSITWSIGIEEQFYIIFPLLIIFVRRNLLPVLLTIFIITACILRMSYSNWIPPYVLLYCRMDALSFGAIVAWINYYHDLKSIAKKYFFSLLGILTVDFFICAYLFIRYNDLGAVKNSLFAIAFAIMLVFALSHPNSWYGRLLSNRLLVWIGTISYSLYLFHYLILGLFHHFIGNKQGVGIYNSTDFLISILALVTSLGFSWLVYRYLETPMVQLGRRFKY